MPAGTHMSIPKLCICSKVKYFLLPIIVFFPSVLWHCWLGDRKGIRPVKKLDVGWLVVMMWLELCTTYSSGSPVVTTHHLHHPLLQWTPANPGSPGKWPLKRRASERAHYCIIIYDSAVRRVKSETVEPKFSKYGTCDTEEAWYGISLGVKSQRAGSLG